MQSGLSSDIAASSYKERFKLVERKIQARGKRDSSSSKKRFKLVGISFQSRGMVVSSSCKDRLQLVERSIQRRCVGTPVRRCFTFSLFMLCFYFFTLQSLMMFFLVLPSDS